MKSLILLIACVVVECLVGFSEAHIPRHTIAMVFDFRHLTNAMTKEERINGFKKLAIECAAAEGATDDDMAEIFARKTPTSRAGKCVHACLGERIGIMKNNQVDVESVAAVADMAYDGDARKVQVARELANDCAGITDADRCDAAVKIFECGHNAVKTRGITFEDV